MSSVRQELFEQALANWPIEAREHVSASSIKTFLRCPNQYRLRYLRDEKEMPAGRLILGSAHHAMVEHNFGWKANTYNDRPLAELQEKFVSVLDERVEEDGGAGEVDWGKTAPTDPQLAHAEAKDKGVQLTKAWRELAAPRFQPTAVEREFRVTLDGVPVPIIGAIDVEAALIDPLAPRLKTKGSDTCHECGDDLTLAGLFALERGLCALCAGDTIIESKTAAKKEMPGDARVQAMLYQIARPLPVDVQLAVKTKVPQIVTGEFIIPYGSRSLRLALLKRGMAGIGLAHALYGKDEPWPHNMTAIGVCSYCGWGPNASGRCEWWREGAWRAA